MNFSSLSEFRLLAYPVREKRARVRAWIAKCRNPKLALASSASQSCKSKEAYKTESVRATDRIVLGTVAPIGSV